MNFLQILFKNSWKQVIFAMLMGFLSGTSSTGLIALINEVLNQSDSQLTFLFWCFVSLCMILLFTNIASQTLLAKLSEGAVYEMRMLLSRQILETPLRKLEEIGLARLLAILTDDIQSVSNAFYSLPFLCTNVAIIVSCIIYLFWLSPSVLLFAIILIFLGMISIQWLQNKGSHTLNLAREQQDDLWQHFRTLTTGIKELKLNQERQHFFFSQNLQSSAELSRRYNIIGRKIFAIASSWGLLSIFIALGISIFLLPQLLAIDSKLLSNYTLAVLYLIFPLQTILNLILIYQKANIAVAKIKSLGISLNSPSIAKKSYRKLVQAKWKKLQLVDVTYVYSQQESLRNFIIEPINLIINAGEIIFIVGGNGSGKSTLAKLIVGLYTPKSGSIYLDNILINDSNLEWYHQHFSAVFSDFYLFERLSGNSSYSLDFKGNNYLKKLKLEKKVKINNSVFSTTKLSQGQCKRLALLTACLEERSLILFDEWAADQDPVFKQIFYTQILPDLKKQGKTVLVITHDDSYFYACDRIVKLEDGKLTSIHGNVHSS